MSPPPLPAISNLRRAASCREANLRSHKVHSKKSNAAKVEGDNNLKRKDSISPAASRAQRHLKWCNRRKSASSGRKISFDDSITQSLMASFDNVPELSGHVDMDSTSCSVCSSEDVSSASRSFTGPPHIRSPASFSDPTQLTAPQPMPLIAKSPMIHLADDDEDATLGSSSDSFTLDGCPPELPSPDSSVSEASPSPISLPSPLPGRRISSNRQLAQCTQLGLSVRPRPRPLSSISPLSSSLNELTRVRSLTNPLSNSAGDIPCTSRASERTSCGQAPSPIIIGGSAPHSPNPQRLTNNVYQQLDDSSNSDTRFFSNLDSYFMTGS